MSGIGKQILSETPSDTTAQVSANSESQETNTNPSGSGDDINSRFNLLAKMERKLKEREQGFKSRDKEWEDKSKKFQEMEELLTLMDTNPLEAIKKRKGWGLQELNEFAVQNSTDDDLDPVAKIHKTHAEKMKELEERLTKQMEEKILAKEKEIQGREHEGQVKQFKSDIKGFLVENKDEYEFINAEENGFESVFDLIYEDIQRQREDGVEDDQLKVMDIKEAAEKVENYLDKQYSRFLSLKKVRSRLGDEDSNERNDLGQFIAQSKPSTIDSSFSPKSKSTNELSPEERRQAAIDLLRSQQT